MIRWKRGEGATSGTRKSWGVRSRGGTGSTTADTVLSLPLVASVAHYITSFLGTEKAVKAS